MAVLSGDGLLSYAFEYIARYTKDVPAERTLDIIARCGKCVGALGLVGGQVDPNPCLNISGCSVGALGLVGGQEDSKPCVTKQRTLDPRS